MEGGDIVQDTTDQEWRVDRADQPPDEQPAMPVPDDLFGILSRQMRRRVLSVLFEQPETTAGELADAVAELEPNDADAVERQAHGRIEVELCHVHLPTLAGANLVEYDNDTGEVTLCDLASPVRDVIRLAQRYEQATEQKSSH